MGEGEVRCGGAFSDGDFLRKRFRELRMPGFHGVGTIGEGAVNGVGAIGGGDGAVNAVMNIDPGFHPAMYVALKAVDAGHGKSFGIRVSLRGLGEVGEVFAAVAGAGLMTGDADIVEGEIAVVEANDLPGLHGEGVRHELAMGLINQRRCGGHVGSTWAAFDGDDNIGKATIGRDFPARVDDFAVSAAKGISADIDDLAQRGGFITTISG